MNLPPDLLSQARRLVADRLGLDLSSREQDLESALGRLLAASGSWDTDLAWLRALADKSPPWQRLASELTVGETCFFRDKGASMPSRRASSPRSSRSGARRGSRACGSGVPPAPRGKSRTPSRFCSNACFPIAPIGL